MEKDDNLALTLAVGDILERNGVNVIYTRTNDIYESPAQKAELFAKLFLRQVLPVAKKFDAFSDCHKQTSV